MINRRKHHRVTIKAVSDVFCRDDNQQFKAFVGGISRGGLEIYSKAELKKDCQLDISLHFKDKDGTSVKEEINGKVRWSAPLEGDYVSGIEFEREVDPKRNPALAEYLLTAEDYLKTD